MKNKKRICCWLALSLILGLSVLGRAQAGRGQGRLAGTITDAGGRPIVGAQVLLVHMQGFKAEALSDAKGRWAIAGLGTGRVVLRILAEGYRSATIHTDVRQLVRRKPLPIVLEPAAGDASLRDGPSLGRIVAPRSFERLDGGVSMRPKAFRRMGGAASLGSPSLSAHQPKSRRRRPARMPSGPKRLSGTKSASSSSWSSLWSWTRPATRSPTWPRKIFR